MLLLRMYSFCRWNLTSRTHNVSIQADHWTTNHSECLQCTVYEWICRLNSTWSCLLSKSGWQGTITLPVLNCFSHGQNPVSWNFMVMSYPFSTMLLDTQSLHLGVAGHAVLSFLALVVACLHLAAAAGLGSSFPGSGLGAGTSLQSWHCWIFLAAS